MTLAATISSPKRTDGTQPERDPAARALSAPATGLVLGMAVYALTQIGLASDVWTAGVFMDTDDAMRVRQVRELMAGRTWFDAIEPAMNWPDGVRLHWSHVVDLGIVALIKLFGLGLDPVAAERAARIAFPALCFFASLALLAGIARRMVGSGGALAVAMTAPLSLYVAQFSAGRVDHHGPQIALLIAMAAALAISLDPARAKSAAWAGLAAALSLAISVENLPFIVVVSGIYALALAWRADQGRAAAWFGGAFALGTALGWLVFADRGAGPVCDALSTFHVAMACLGGLGLAVIGAASSAPSSRLGAPARWGAVAALGLAAGMLAKTSFPQCLGDPLAGLPPLMTERWLARVVEAKPLLRHPHGLPTQAAIGVPIAAGLLAMLAAALASRSVDRARWLALAALVAVGLTASTWQVRAASSTLPLALLGAAVAAAAAARATEAGKSALALLAPCLATLPFVGLFWLAILPMPTNASTDVSGQAAAPICWTPESMRALARLPQGLVLTSIDPGSLILVSTPHRVLAGAYHRNVAGDMDALSALTGSLDEARALLRRRKVDYVATCDDLSDMKNLALDAPDGLAAKLTAGAVPAWLEPAPLDGPWRVYRPK